MAECTLARADPQPGEMGVECRISTCSHLYSGEVCLRAEGNGVKEKGQQRVLASLGNRKKLLPVF